MQINIRKGLIGYIFLLVLGSVCIYIGAITFDDNIPSAIFSVILGVALLGIGLAMAIRKN